MKITNNPILLAAVIALLLALFVLSQKVQTISTLYQRSETATQQMDEIRNAPALIASQQKEISELERRTRRLKSSGKSIENQVDMTSYLEKMCLQQNLKLVSLPRGEVNQQEGVKKLYTAFSVEGNLADILRGIHQLEYEDRAAVVQSLGLQTESWYERGQVHYELIADVEVTRMLVD